MTSISNTLKETINPRLESGHLVQICYRFLAFFSFALPSSFFYNLKREVNSGSMFLWFLLGTSWRTPFTTSTRSTNSTRSTAAPAATIPRTVIQAVLRKKEGTEGFLEQLGTGTSTYFFKNSTYILYGAIFLHAHILVFLTYLALFLLFF
jgi:hypothetical protein